MLKSLLIAAAASILAPSLCAQSGATLYRVDGFSSSNGNGGALASLGDINGDGVDDFVMGGDQYITFGSTSAIVFSGADGAVIYSWSGFNNAEAVANAGDVDNDGVNDIIIGSIWTNSSAGQAKVYSGATGILLYTFDGAAGSAYLGNAVSSAGDINGDGFDDLLIGAWGETGAQSFSGAAYIYSGADGSELRRIGGSFDSGYFGHSVAGVGDVDGDSVPDQLIGELGNATFGSNTGAVYLYSGATGALIQTWIGPHGNSRFGERVAAVGDLDGDGFGECIIGAQFEDPGTGAAHVISLATGTTLFVLKGYEPTEVFARSVAGSPDVDGDGTPDLLVGSDRFYSSGGYTGMVRVFSGADGQELQRFSASSATGRLGLAVAGLGDVNGDGFGDYVAGAPEEGFAGFKSGSAYVVSGALLGLHLAVENWGPSSTATFRIRGGTAFGSALIGYSLVGAGPTPTAYGDVAMTAPIQTLASITLDANGFGEYQQGLPAAIAGRTVWSQALDLGSGTLSNPNPLLVN